jgi:iron(III) transport system permease protein
MGGTLVFLTSLGDIGAPLLVGGNYRVLPVEIYSNFVSFLGDDRIPVVFSAWIILMACLMMLVVNRLLKRTELKHSFRTRAITYDLPGLRRAATVFLALVTILFLLPYATIVVSSFGTVWTTKWLPNAFTLDNYKTAFTDSVAIRNSLILMAGAMPFTLFLSITFGQMNRDVPYMRWFDFITMLPFIIPGVVIGLSITRAWGAVKIGGFDLGGTVLVLLIAISIRRMPHAIRVLSAGFARIDKSLEEASWSLGASRSKTFKDVILPQLKPTIVASGVILSIKLITELGASLILYPPGWRTIPIYIYYYVSEGQIARGSAMGILLIVIIAVGNGIANRLTKDRGGI